MDHKKDTGTVNQRKSLGSLLGKCFCCPIYRKVKTQKWNPINRKNNGTEVRRTQSTVRFAKVNKVAPLRRSSTSSSWREILQQSSSELSLLSDELDEFVDSYVDQALRRVSALLMMNEFVHSYVEESAKMASTSCAMEDEALKENGAFVHADNTIEAI